MVGMVLLLKILSNSKDASVMTAEMVLLSNGSLVPARRFSSAVIRVEINPENAILTVVSASFSAFARKEYEVEFSESL